MRSGRKRACRAWGHVLLGVLIAAPTVAAQQEGEGMDSLGMTAHNEERDFWFELEGAQGRNPAIALRPGDEVAIAVENRGTTIHNLHFGTQDKSRLLNPGESDRFVVRVPDDAQPQDILYYWCDPHRDFGMIGSVRIATDAEEATTPEESAERDVPAAPVVLVVACVALALVARRR